MGGGLESRGVGRVCGADSAVRISSYFMTTMHGQITLKYTRNVDECYVLLFKH